MSALFCEQQDVGRMKYTKNVLMRSLILFAAIYQMHAVLNLLIIHEKQKIKKIILLLVKQNRKLKNSEFEGSKDKKKKNLRGSNKGAQMNGGKICYLEIPMKMTGRKTLECLVNCFMNFLITLFLILVQIFIA